MHDLIVIGAGPAGMQAALTAAEHGLSVLILDEQPRPGGQIYRNVEAASAQDMEILGEDYRNGLPLAKAVRAKADDGSIRYIPNAMTWQVTDGREVGYSVDGQAHLITAPRIILATGAMERPFPIEDWTLPGVMTAGAAQTLLKSSGLAVEGAVFAGCGPLLALILYQYVKAGMPVAAFLDTTPVNGLGRALPHLPGALRRADMLWKGWRWLSEIKRAGVPVIKNVTDVKALGDEKVTGVSYRRDGGDWQTIEAEHLLLHQGVTPNVNLSMAAGLDHDWDGRQLCWRPRLDRWRAGSVPGISVAGDGAGIEGAAAARLAGAVAALGAAYGLGRFDGNERDRLAKPLFKALNRETAIRPFLDAWFEPASRFRVPASPSVIVCRCEELTAGAIGKAIEDGGTGPNQLKAFCRAGMGPCQGRFCGLTVQAMIAQRTGQAPDAVGYYRLRPPIKPLPLRELAAMAVEIPETPDGSEAGHGATAANG